MTQSTKTAQTPGKPVPDEFRPVLIAIGRGLGTVSVYGKDHPSVQQIVETAFAELATVLKTRPSFSIGTFNGTLTVDELPVDVRDVPIRTLEKRLSSMKISHLALTRGLTPDELANLLTALSAPNDEQMKESLQASGGASHVQMKDVKYVALHGDEETTGGGTAKSDSGSGGQAIDEIPAIQVNQIVAFLKGEPGGGEASADVKEMLSDPEKLGQMILEAASIRQSGVSVQDGESMADLVVGCLRRTYGGLRKESEFQSPQGKVNLNKAMMLLEKNVLDKIHRALGAQHPEIDRRIFDAIREMEEEQQFEMLTAHYFDQRRKIERVEDKIVESIKKQGAEKAREQFDDMDMDPKDWKRLMVKAGANAASGGGSGPGGGAGGGLDMGALAVVLEKLEGLMQIESDDPAQVKTAVNVSRSGMKNYTDRIESRIQELEGQVEMSARSGPTLEDHAEHLNREGLMLEVSKLTLSLIQPLTVVNAAVEAALRHAEKDVQKDLLELANESGRRMQSLTKRLMTLVGYPSLDPS